MDKHKNEQISIRINGKERLFLSDEELNQEIAAAKDIEENEMEVIKDSVINNVIDFEERRNGRGRKQGYKKPFKPMSNSFLDKSLKKRRLLLKKFAIVLLSAIIIGTGFGYVVLSLFTDFSEEQSNGNSANVSEAGQAILENNTNADAAPQGTQQQGETFGMLNEVSLGTKGVGGSSATDGTNSMMGIAPLKIEVIQGGAFASVESANEFAAALKKGGSAAVILPESKPVLMFIGLGTNRNESEIIGDFYLKKGQEVYLKPFELSGIGAGKVNNREVADFVSIGLSLYQTLVKLSTQAFQTNTIEKSAWKDVDVQFSEWQDAKPQKLPASLTQFSNSVAKAYESLAAYKTKANEVHLWNSQQALLEGLVSYKKWHDDMR
ncbi:MAG TPA: hypothetical protein GX497_06400 [Bacillus bacterium]|nr:hypothetical protein [Bacillus sp. (in: firmicutes)]